MRKKVGVISLVGIFIVSVVGCSHKTAPTLPEVVVSGGAIQQDSGVAQVVGTEEVAGVPGEWTDYSQAETIVLVDGKVEHITQGGYYSFSGVARDGQIIIDTTDKVYIELAGVTIENSTGPAIVVENAKKITVTLKAGTENKLVDGGAEEDRNAVLFSRDTMVIEGDGSLVVTANNADGIKSTDDLIINGGNITVTAKSDGIRGKDNVTINGGVLEIDSEDEGIESKADLIINGGKIVVRAKDDGLNAATDITINGGTLYITATQGDAIDSNGTIHITGGTTVAVGGRSPEAGIDCDNNELSITGGTLVAVGGSNSRPTAATTTQPTLMLGVNSSNNTFCLTENDVPLILFAAESSYQSVVLSSPLVALDTAYALYTDGEIIGGESFGGLYTGATYEGGKETLTFTSSSMVTMQGETAGMGGGKMFEGEKPMGGRGEKGERVPQMPEGAPEGMQQPPNK